MRPTPVDGRARGAGAGDEEQGQERGADHGEPSAAGGFVDRRLRAILGAVPEPGPKLPDRKQFGSYELLAPLAVGGTAEIFLARMTGAAGFEKIVVVKQLLEHLAEDEEFVDMFLDEARLGSHLHHSNIVQVLDLGQVEGRYYIAMEYVAGMTLAQLAAKAQMRVKGGLPIDITVALAQQACVGLHHAHEARMTDGTWLKIVHRDVSPQNLVVTFGGDLKIVDFGIAHAAVREAKTKTGMIKGKFAYMSPEQCLGKPLDRRTDVFALGTVLWECVTGQRLFKKKTTYETYQTIVSGKVLSPSKVNPAVDAELEEIILRSLAYRPEDRWQSAEAFGEALASYGRRSSKRVTSLDVSKFVERFFQPEIEEHRQRLQQIMAGRSRPVTTEASWDGELDDAEKAALLSPDGAAEWSSSVVDTLETRPATLADTADLHAPKGRLPLPAPEATAITTIPSEPTPPSVGPLTSDELRELLAPSPSAAAEPATRRRKKTAPVPVVEPTVEGTEPRGRRSGRTRRKKRPKQAGRAANTFLWIGIVLLLVVVGGASAVIAHQLGYQVPLLGPWLEVWLP
jgi:eukaryotic-like serine/threonine-protein kinase